MSRTRNAALFGGLSFLIVTVSMLSLEVDVLKQRGGGDGIDGLARQSLPTADLKQTQLIYMHIAKTGGTTFNTLLPKLVGAERLNCQNFVGCCDKNYEKLKDAKLLSATVRACGHYSYEETWHLPLDTEDFDSSISHSSS